MKLNLGAFEVEDVVFDSETAFADGVLRLNEQEIKDLVVQDGNLAGVRVDIVKPGERKRIIHVLDVIEPRIKLDSGLESFPGFMSAPITVGRGTTHRLSGVAVMESAELPWDAGGLLIPREGIIDMVGPGKYYSPFHKTINIVLSFELAEGRSDMEYDVAVRLAGIKVSKYLAETVRSLTPDVMDVFSTENRRSDLPNVVYIHQYQSQGTYAHTYCYGKDMYDNLPTVINPNEMIDGGLVSGNYAYACFKTPTYLHCNNPVVLELYKGHGINHNFAGVVIARGHNYTFYEKLRSAQYAAKLAKELDAQGAIITWEGGGNSAIEAMQTVKACEEVGIKAVIIAYEMGGPEGDAIALLDSVEEADAIVSAGSIEKKIVLPPLTPVGGGELRLARELGGIRMDASGSLEFDISHEMYCGANQTGFGLIAARDH
ncbi:MAG: glycine/sarcosine/betaine reductase component B subunit [Clostridia bacterium]|nr:glycine/sarcosine/betaine reductase component B subunit [Clostridia bacterium]